MNRTEIKTKSNLKRWIFILGVFILVLFFFYSYALAKTTTSAHTIHEKKLAIQELETEIIDLETEYFEIINGIDRDNFASYGLEKVSTLEYVSRETSSQFASL